MLEGRRTSVLLVNNLHNSFTLRMSELKNGPMLCNNGRSETQLHRVVLSETAAKYIALTLCITSDDETCKSIGLLLTPVDRPELHNVLGKVNSSLRNCL